MVILFVFVFLFSPLTIFAQETPVTKNTVVLQDNQIIVQTEQGAKALIYSEPDKYSDVQLKKWKIKEGTDTVSEALKVYKSRSAKPFKTKKIWLVNKNNEKQQIFVKYSYSGGREKVMFSPDEDFILFFDLSASGDTVIAAKNLVSREQFVLGKGRDFNIMSCPDHKSYVIVQNEKGQNDYFVYDLKEHVTVDLDPAGPIENLDKFICY